MDTKTWLELLGVIVSLAGLTFSVIIYRKQDPQLLSLRDLSTGTSEMVGDIKKVTQGIRALTERKILDDHRDKFTSAFFRLGGRPQSHFKCYFPAKHDTRPMSMVFAGDYYALHVFQSLLGNDRLDLCPLPENTKSSRPRF